MERITISLPPEVVACLREMATKRRVSMASIVREALKEDVLSGRQEIAEEKTPHVRPKLTIIGSGDSGYTDTSELLSKGSPPPVSWR